MGSVFSSIGSAIAAPIGGLIGGLGGGIANAAGATNNYQAAAPEQSEQDALAQQLLAESQGNGPNPAQTQYLRNAQTAAQMAATANAQNRALNPGLAARGSAYMGAQTAGDAASIAAQLQQQQQLAAQNQLGGLYGQMANQNLSAQGINAGVSGQNATIRGQIAGGLLNGGAGVGAAALGAAHGGKIPSLHDFANALMQYGGHVPGQAQVAGDSKKNDVVPTMLSPGEIVIPRSQAQSPDTAKAFIDYLMKNPEGDAGDYKKVAQAKTQEHSVKSKLKRKSA